MPAPVSSDRVNHSASLLPRSGIGVDVPYLVIAPPGNPTITLDARLLDRIELASRPTTTPMVVAGASAGLATAAAISLIPGGIVVAAIGGYVAVERAFEAKKRTQSKDLLLCLGSLEVVLHVVDGPSAAKGICDALSQYTRSAPITNGEVYEDAKRRMRSHAEQRSDNNGQSDAGGALAVGDEPVWVREGFLQVGTVAFRISEVREHALRGANLALSGGRLLQAALGLLVVAAEERAKAGEDLTLLSKRIAEFEAWSGHSAGR